MKKIIVDMSKCVGHGRCYSLADEFFEADDEGFPEIVDEVVDEAAANYAELRKAVDNCPERAISLVDHA